MEPVEIVSKQLEKQNEILQRILDKMPGQTNKFTRVLETAVLIVTVFGFITIADVVIRWFAGG